MTKLEITLTIIVWLMVGSFICYKRNWYKDSGIDRDIFLWSTIIFTPLSLMIVIWRELIVDDWNNKNL